ncbi:hypothetical protein EDC01DRAFT_758641 [Geopyxis carbonaria]|nr:hypothetical protein EDC01DRAFT_758641 [Geopyxis carbonaria]
MTDSSSRRTPASATVPHDYSILPPSAPAIIKKNTVSIHNAKQIQSVVEEERRRSFQGLVRRYMNQLLYGCQREQCQTPTCYTARKLLGRNANSSRRLTLLSARITACHLATQDDPLQALCPGKPVVPSLSSRSRDLEESEDHDEKSERDTAPHGSKGPIKRQSNELELVNDKGLKDPKSFTQQLFSTFAVKMVEWIGIPPTNKTFGTASESSETGATTNSSTADSILPSPQEPPKFKFPNNPMEVMDTGRLNRDSEPVSQTRHQEILQQPPRKRTVSLKDVVTPTPHSNAAKAKFNMPNGVFAIPPVPTGGDHTNQRRSVSAPQITPSRGEKHTQTLWETPEVVTPPQSLNKLDEHICKALVAMCTSQKISKAERRDAAIFAKQSIFYVFSNPELLLASFGGIGTGESIDFDPQCVDRSLEVILKSGWWPLVKRSIWKGMGKVFSKPGKGLSEREAAGMIIISLHVLANGISKNDQMFDKVTKQRATGKVSSMENEVLPDIGFEDEIAERLMKRVLRAISFRASRSEKMSTSSHVIAYLKKCAAIEKVDKKKLITEEFGEDLVGLVNDGRPKSGWGFARCALEWTRTIFMANWDGYGIVQKNSLVGSCIDMFSLLHTSGTIPWDIYQTWVIGERIDPYTWPVDWFHSITPTSSTDIHILDHPYMISLEHIVTFFRSINIDLMKKAYETAITNIRLTGQMGDITKVGYQALASKTDKALSIYFVIVIRRTHLLEDAFNQLIHREHRELVRPLKIKFADGEEGVDQGGVQQEFFVLLLQEILKPDHGVFTTDERTRLSWFWEGSLEGMQKFELVGLVVGLAVYNCVTLPVNFPKALYIKLLDGQPTLDDIDDYWPELHKGLNELLAWKDGDVGDVFMRTYEYSYSVFGQVRSVDMIKAKTEGPEFLEQPVPKLKRKAKARVEAAEEKKTLDYETSLGELGDWLPIGAEDGWMEVLQVMDREEEDNEERRRRSRTQERGYTVSYRDLSEELGSENGEGSGIADEDGNADSEHTDHHSSEEADDDDSPPLEEIPEGNTARSETGESQKSWETVGPDEVVATAASLPLPEDSPDDFGGNREESIYERAERVLEEEMLTHRAEQEKYDKEGDKSGEEEEEAPLVTNANRADFVQDYISWLTDRAIRRQYTAFARGFFAVNNRRKLSLFTPATLQNLVEGHSASEIDVAKLEAHARYEDGYHANHRVIKDFWAVVRQFSDARRRLLLEFVTSSARVPIGGIENIMFYIVRNGEDSERVPTSLTCFGRLLLPEYSNRKKLREKLRLALENSKGFGSA